jgi:allophanate hydrolase subunit 2
VLGPDAPVTGGYPVIAILGKGELDRVAQLRPGEELRFQPA